MEWITALKWKALLKKLLQQIKKNMAVIGKCNLLKLCKNHIKQHWKDMVSNVPCNITFLAKAMSTKCKNGTNPTSKPQKELGKILKKYLWKL